jgi:hypothetical protein
VVLAVVVLAAAGLLIAGGWWTALGYTLLGLAVLVGLVTIFGRSSRGQHAGGGQDDPAERGPGERLAEG